MKAVVILFIGTFVMVLGSGATFAQETEEQKVDMSWTKYEHVMVGRKPVAVDMPTEQRLRGGQRVIDFSRYGGKDLERAPALEVVSERSGVIEQ